MTNFIAFDGEAIDGRYSLLACKDGYTHEDHVLDTTRELTTYDCFKFLIRNRPVPRHRKDGGEICVCYGLNYDVNMWIRNIPRLQLTRLWETGRLTWERWQMEWVPKRWFILRDCDGATITIYEPIGFFQTTFVNACEMWDVVTDADLAAMKERRGQFTSSKQDVDRIIHYCLQECRSLALLMEVLQMACEDANIIPSRWIGTGALAQSLLNREGVKVHHQHDNELIRGGDPTPILCAYKGGRVECLEAGVFEQAQSADLISAYPAAMVNLPSLKGAELVPCNKWVPTARHSIWHVRWRKLRGRVMPFATRHNEAIYYNSSGEGWYHNVEVLAARAVFGDMIEVDCGYILRGGSATLPFAWVPDVYNERRQLKEAGAPAERVLKLALNSLYGKMAQGIGYKNKVPPYQSYFWAGEITATTRARMFQAAIRAVRPVMIATDGLFVCMKEAENKWYESGPSRKSNEKDPILPVPGLGGWDVTWYKNLFVAQPGIYSAEDPPVNKSRGFKAVNLDYDELQQAWEEQEYDGSVTFTSNMFHGLGACMIYTGPQDHKRASAISDRWRTWADVPRRIDLEPTRKTIAGPRTPGWIMEDVEEGDLIPFYKNMGESEPYRPKTQGVLDTNLKLEKLKADQPHPEQ